MAEDEPGPKRHQDILNRIEKVNPDALPAHEDLTKAERKEVFDVYLDHACRGYSVVEICQRRASSGETMLSPRQIRRHIDTAAAWSRYGSETAAEVIRAKALFQQRVILQQIENVQEQLAEGGGKGIPKKTIKIKRKPKKDQEVKLNELHKLEIVDSIEETMTFEDATPRLVSLATAYAKLLQVEMVATGVQKIVTTVDAPTSITIHLPAFEQNMFTTRPKSIALDKPSKNGTGKNGTKP